MLKHFVQVRQISRQIKNSTIIRIFLLLSGLPQASEETTLKGDELIEPCEAEVR